MRKSLMSFDGTKRMFYNRLSSFVIMRIPFYIIIIDVHGILVFAAVNDAFGKFGTLIF